MRQGGKVRSSGRAEKCRIVSRHQSPSACLSCFKKVMKAGSAGGKEVALVWDTGEMKAVDSKNLTQLESMASVLPAQNMVLFWVYTSMAQEAVSDLKDWNRWGSEKGSCLPPPGKKRSKS